MGGHEALWELAASWIAWPAGLRLGRLPDWDTSGSKVGSWLILGGFGGILIEL